MRFTSLMIALALLVAGAGCGSQEKEDEGFFTSGSREADQRAEQRMAKSEQMNPAEGGSNKPSEKKTAEDLKKLTLYERLGGEKGVEGIVNDFVDRAMADPRVNWDRKGVTRGGVSLSRNKSVQWDANPDNVKQLKKHIAQFIAVSSGGPTHYDGKKMNEAHAGLHITNAEFDATIGAMKSTLDKLQVPNPEQKELLAIIESTRPQVAEKR